MADRRPPYDPKNFNPSDPATWPGSDESVRDWESRHEIPTPYGVEVITIKADPEKPGDVESAKAHAAEEKEKIRALRPPLSPEQLAAIAASEAAVAAEIDAGMGQRARPPAPPVAAANTPSRQRESDPKAKLLSSLFDRFVGHQKKSKLKTGRSEDTYRMKFQVFLDWFGDTHIEDVLPEDISSYKDYMLHEIEVGAGKKKGQKGLKATTVDNYVGVINGLYVWARRNGHFPRQMLPPTQDQRMVSKATKKAMAKSGKVNRAFRIDELIKAFDAKVYRSENRLSHHFWPPLIALYTGMRLGEVSQLACRDILMEEGVWAISINDEDYKNVKSAAARRTIPLHPELFNLGLLQFVEDVRSLELGPQLFPVMRPNADNSYGNAAGKKWGNYLDATGFADEALTFHSFRRTANTLLKKKKVPFDVRCQMVGHDLDHVNEFYASEFTVVELAEMILPKFVFENLDLSGLKYVPGEFNEAIRTGLAEAIADEERRALEKKRAEERAKGKA